jgi:hypothetical protein
LIVKIAAAEYIRAVSDAMHSGYPATCVVHAIRIAELLRDENRSPWIGRIRDVTPLAGTTFHGPLMPTRFSGKGLTITWTTHYVACSGRDAYDPLAGIAIDIAGYTRAVFGRELVIETYLDPHDTERMLDDETLRRQFHAGRLVGSLQ